MIGFEARVPMMSPDVQFVHRMVEALRDRPEDSFRWGLHDGEVVIRAARPSARGGTWRPMVVPPVGAEVAFRLLAVPRLGGRNHKVMLRKGTMARINATRPVQTPEEARRWLHRQLAGEAAQPGREGAAGAGLDDLECRAARVDVPVIRKPVRFVAPAVLYHGEATVTDPERLGRAMLTGIGDQKAYGFGLLLLLS